MKIITTKIDNVKVRKLYPYQKAGFKIKPNAKQWIREKDVDQALYYLKPHKKMTKQDQIQEEIIEKLLKFYSDYEKGYLNLAMRAGKTRITIEYLKRVWGNDAQILVLYPDNKLLQTWKDELVKWNFNPPNIKFSNFSSLKKCNDQDWDVIICDEFHSLSPNEEKLLKGLSGSMWLFLSGTITQETKDKWPEFEEIAQFSTLDGIKEGILADYQISVHLVNLDTKVATPNKAGTLKTEKQKYDAFSWVIKKIQREGGSTMHLALARNRLSLSSLGKLNHLKKMLETMKDKRVLIFTGLADVADSIGIPSYHSKSENNLNFLAFQNKHINHLALAAMGKVGVTYPDLDSVILLNFTYNKEDSSQILNRAIKLDYQGKIADLHVICLNEDPEIKKIKESLSMLDQSKIKYVLV